jgi:hypothetical protein
MIVHTPVVPQWLSLLTPQVFKFGCYIAIPIFMTAAFVTNPDRLAAIIKNVSQRSYLLLVPERLIWGNALAICTAASVRGLPSRG